MNERNELLALRRLAELEAKAQGFDPQQLSDLQKKERTNFDALSLDEKKLLTSARKAGHISKVNRGTAEEAAQSVVDDMSGIERYGAGMGKFFVDTGRSIKQLVGGSGAALGGAGTGQDMYGRAVSVSPQAQQFMERDTQSLKDLQAEIDESRQTDAPLMRTWGGTLGNITPALATAAIPGAGTVTGAAAIGAGQGFLEPVATGESRLGNTGRGALFAGGSTAVLNTAGRLIKPNVSPLIKKLMDEGITPTPGQIAGEGGIIGRGLKRLEESATSIPLVGDIIKGAQARGIEDFNIAAVNRVLAPLGKKLEKGAKPGREAIEKAHQTVSAAYDDLLPKLSASADDKFMTAVESIRSQTAILPDAEAAQFDKVLEHVIGKRMSGKVVTGDDLKSIQTQLRQHAEAFTGKQNDANKQMLGRLFGDVNNAFRDMVTRQNPKYAPRLRNIDRAYATLTRVEQAAGTIGTDTGVFNPEHLVRAVRSKDKSLNKRQFVQGRALLQDLAEGGKKVLSQKLPDSGTAPRLLANMAIGSGVAGAAGTGYIPPEYLLAAGVLGGAYTKPGQKILAAALTKRGPINNLSPRTLALIDALKRMGVQGATSEKLEE